MHMFKLYRWIIYQGRSVLLFYHLMKFPPALSHLITFLRNCHLSEMINKSFFFCFHLYVIIEHILYDI